MCRLLIIIDSPVCGLRPRRGDFSCTMKLPKWTSLIDSPLINVFFSVENKVSTISAAFLCEIPSFSVTEVASSFLVTLFKFIVQGNGWSIWTGETLTRNVEFSGRSAVRGFR